MLNFGKFGSAVAMFVIVSTAVSMTCLAAPPPASAVGRAGCPLPEQIAPCTCTVNGVDVDVDCSAVDSSDQIHNIFMGNDVFPLRRMNSFTLIGNPNVVSLFNGFLNGHSFKEIHIAENPSLALVHSGAFDGCETTLLKLNISGNAITELLLFDKMDQFTVLEVVDLGRNQIGETIPSSFLCGPALTELWLHYNNIAAISPNAFDQCAALLKLGVGGNPITLLEKDVFAGLPVIQEIRINVCPNLNTILDGAFASASPDLDEIHLAGNPNLRTIQPNAFGTPANPDLVISMRGSGLITMTETVFKDILTVMKNGGGIIDVTGSPIQCKCDMAWLMGVPVERIHIKGNCPDGIPISEQDIDLINGGCQPKGFFSFYL